MKEKLIRELIADKDEFMEHVMNTVVTQDIGERFGIEEKVFEDDLGREVFWEIGNTYTSRQYRIYPSRESNYYIIYFTSDGMVAFVDKNDEDCSEKEFFTLVNEQI